MRNFKRLLQTGLFLLSVTLGGCAGDGPGVAHQIFSRFGIQSAASETTDTLMNRVREQQQKAARGELPGAVPIREPYKDFRV